jgi:hypothetical protein
VRFRRKPTTLAEQGGRIRPNFSERPTAKVFSYYSSRAPEQGAVRERQQGGGSGTPSSKSSIFLSRTGATLGVTALLVLAVYNSTLSNASKVVAFGTPTQRVLLQDDAVYQDAMNSYLHTSLTNRSKLTINTARMESQLVQQFPELERAEVMLPLVGTQPTLKVQPAEGVARLVASDGKSYILGASGKIISTDTAADGAIPLTIQDQSGLSAAKGTQILPSDSVSFLVALQQQLSQNNLRITSITLPPRVQQLHVGLAGKPYYVKFTFYADPQQQIGAFLAVQRKLDHDHIVPVEYVDARAGDRVFYR